MKIVYTKHALEKFKDPLIVKFKLSKENIEEALRRPDFSGTDPDTFAKFVLKELSLELNLKVIFSEMSDIIVVITFYPVKKGRYEKI